MAKKKPKQWVLKGKKMKCPKCKGTKNLSRNEYVALNTFITVNKDGTWDWSQSRESRVHWDTSDYREGQGEREWRCHDCDIDFDAPDLPVPYKIVEAPNG